MNREQIVAVLEAAMEAAENIGAHPVAVELRYSIGIVQAAEDIGLAFVERMDELESCKYAIRTSEKRIYAEKIAACKFASRIANNI